MCFVCLALALSQPAFAQNVAAPATETLAPLTRDANGQTTVRATRVSQKLRIDGVLDEELYRTVEPASGLIQIEPRAGEPEGQRTDF